jgi:alkaline phosphatase D
MFPTMTISNLNRRQFLRDSSLSLGLTALGMGASSTASAGGPAAPAIISSDRPGLPLGLQLGDPSTDGLVVWSRADRAARMIVEYSRDPDFRWASRLEGPVATDETDMTARMFLSDAEPGQSYFVRVAFENTEARHGRGPWLEGSFRLPSLVARKPVRFVWSGDMAGQGWGINPEFGARIYEAMRLRNPDFFLHSGDTIYADGPISAEQAAEGGRIWKNIVTEEVSKVAETLKEYRGRHRYNLLDENVRRFAREVPQIWQWDDHEVVNNWSSSKDLSADTRYTVKDVNLLAARGRRAFLENAPMRHVPKISGRGWGHGEKWEGHWNELPDRIYRHIPYGSLLDVFMLDMRSYRGPNSYNQQTFESAETAFLGNEQIEWLVSKLSWSRATWKVIAADMPIGLNVPDGNDAQGRAKWEAIANGTAGQALGRELEIARLLARIKQAGVRNVVWITADVHYCAAHQYRPEKAAYQNFDSFWEFVAGPLNAGSFGPNTLDDTFGPQVVFQKAPPTANMSPFAGFQFFGEINIDPHSRAMTVDLRDLTGVSQFSQTLAAYA